jgi:hypothetical protein
MKTQNKEKGSTASHMALMGSGAGLTVYLIYGVLKASFLGGVIGLNVAGAIMGMPVESTLISKAIVAVSMLLGVTAGGLVFAMAGATLGWLTGTVAHTINAAAHREKTEAALKH